MKGEKNKRLMIIFIAIIVVLLGIIAYAFVLRPALNGYVIKTQNEGIQYAVSAIMQQVAPPQCKTLPLTLGETTVNVVALECYQQPQNQQTAPTQ